MLHYLLCLVSNVVKCRAVLLTHEVVLVRKVGHDLNRTARVQVVQLTLYRCAHLTERKVAVDLRL